MDSLVGCTRRQARRVSGDVRETHVTATMLMAITSVCPPVHSARRANMSRVSALAPTWARRMLTRSLQSRSPLRGAGGGAVAGDDFGVNLLRGMSSPLAAPASAASASTARVASIDLIRGVAMVLMAIDHVRVYSGLPAGGPTAGGFFMRLVNHLLAPAFVLL